MCGLVIVGLAMVAVTGWGAGVLYFAGPGNARVRAALAIVLGLLGFAAVGALSSCRWRRRAVVGVAAGVVAVGAWWSTLTPSNDRRWQPEVAVLSHATV